MSDVPEAWSGYRALAVPAFDATLQEEGQGPQFEPQEADEILKRSDDLAAAIIEHLGGASKDEQELAALQLQAAAAVDIDRANALAAADDGTAPEAMLSTDRWDVIDRILSTPTEQGISAVVDIDGGGLQATASELGTLKDAVDGAIDKITRDAEQAARTTAPAIASALVSALSKGVSDGAEVVFQVLEDRVSWLKRKALALILKAVQKLLAVFGTKTARMRERIAGWINDLEGDRVKGLLERLYGVDDLKERFGLRLDDAKGGIPAARERTARDELAMLQAKWHTRTSVIGTIGEVASYTKTWIFMISPPAGGIAYTVVFVLATGYVVHAGGDYLDWREGGGLLDLVDGVGSVVDRAVGAPAPG